MECMQFLINRLNLEFNFYETNKYEHNLHTLLKETTKHQELQCLANKA
jgi:hypothetical protein